MKNQTCKHCNQTLPNLSPKVFSNHVRWCDKNLNRKKVGPIGIAKRAKTIKQNTFNRKIILWKEYYLTPKICVECKNEIDWFRKDQMCCSASCAAKVSNRNKTPEQKHKAKNCGKLLGRNNKKVKEPIAPYSKVYKCTCKVSGIVWYSKTVKHIHPSVTETKQQYSYQCRFNFQIKTYSNWFYYSSELINHFGWYAAKNKGDNLTGCSRDHLYSVNDGFINNVDPKIISHPANCEIKPHKQNQSKGRSSSITLTELLDRITTFENKYGRVV